MAYDEFAYWYDELNGWADYDRLADVLTERLRGHGVLDGIVADLGCGTGEITLRLAKAGYDMIGVDASPEMLSVFREKLAEQGETQTLLLCQDLAALDLYGTIRAAVSTFDTLNHLPPERLPKALERTSMFLEPGGLFLFDVNTPHKHQDILGSSTIVGEDDSLSFRWSNQYSAHNDAVQIKLEGFESGRLLFSESFFEFAYPLERWNKLLTGTGFTVLAVEDGEGFGAVTQNSQRWLFTARKA